MSTLIHLRCLLGGAVCLLALGGCATEPVTKAPTIAEVMGKAAAANSAGQKEAALALWKQAAAANPANKDAWTRMAQARFDAGQYGEAIVNAQEVLLRDPNDQLANSIVAISGLRLSTRALADLSRQNNLSGSLRTESQDLARLLRESLGEQVLVPARSKVAVTPPRTPASGRKAGAKPAASSGSDAAASPFDALK